MPARRGAGGDDDFEMTRRFFGAALIVISMLSLPVAAQPPAGAIQSPRKLVPRYPSGRDCPPITSLFSSWDDVDGTKRSRPHSGVDLGDFGDLIIAPAPGTIVAVWRADWGWGPEGALMLRHSKADLGLTDGPDFYYSEFDHLHYDEIGGIHIGRRVARGERLAHVDRPGGDSDYLPEVHWEVWSIADDTATKWDVNEHGGRYWHNATGHLVDPLHMLSLNAPVHADGSVPIQPFDRKRDYRGFRGFTYILLCPPTPAAR